MDKLNMIIHSKYSELVENYYHESVEEIWHEVKYKNCSKCSEPCDKIRDAALQHAMNCVTMKSFLN